MLATIRSASLLGVDGHAVTVEVYVSGGIPSFTVVGLPDATCREARDRVRAALQSSGLEFPLRKITVNLAPTGIRKSGAGLDLAIAVGLLVASDQLEPEQVEGIAFVGELGLDGSLRPVAGTLPLVDAVRADTVVVPPASAFEAELVGRHRVRTARTLADLVEALRGDAPWPPLPDRPVCADPPVEPDLADVRGHTIARLALEVAAAGGHHLLMVGPPGSGKTMLARRLPGLLPDLDNDQALLVTRVHSAAGVGLPPTGLVERPPLRAPHHGLSAVAMIGGGTGSLRPGEISLSHSGVLFLDELGEFSPAVLDALRTPLEEGVVRVARASSRVTFPARFLLVGAMNPCPCGAGGEPGACRCSDAAVGRYARRLSGPLLDRFDLRIVVRPPEPEQLLRGDPGESSAAVAERVATAREIARARGVHANAELGGAELELVAPLEAEARSALERLLTEGRLSARGLRRIRSVARTVADLDDHAGPLSAEHVHLALQLRTEPRFLSMRLAG